MPLYIPTSSNETQNGDKTGSEDINHSNNEATHEKEINDMREEKKMTFKASC